MPVSTDFAKMQEVFLAAVEEHPPDRWDEYLDEACAGDADLRAELARLLQAHAQEGSLPGRAALGIDRTAIYQALAEGPGTVIGPYRLLEQIGEGGFGVVYIAEQQQPVRRKVALKVLKPGMDTRQVVARFEAERQALALMDHPHIARILDGGETASGRPYFVMELVRGVPITDFCDQGRLTIRERLALFLSVCQAVQHAHQKGIIHRDLKPSNVLVTVQDTVPVAKVIDFGVAKALGQELTDKTLFTGLAQMIGTPLYMSPEQAGHSGLDVDTRSDVYSLGVLLYELLTGTTPFDRERFKHAGYDQVRRIIREEEPARPSTRLSTLGRAADSVSANRQSDPRHLSQMLRGELDWVAMRALEKDRNRRYETADAFAADVQRYLNDEPVQACPASAWYRFRKFARRNRGTLATSAGFGLLLLLACGVVAGSVGWALRDREARRVAVAARFDQILQESGRLYLAGKVPEATAAARKAQELLTTDDGSQEMHRRLRGWLADLDLVARLEAVRLRWGDFLLGTPDYAEVFRAYGIDPEAIPAPEAAARIAARPIRIDLAVALDVWAWRSRNPGFGQRLREIAMTADPDPVRNRIRQVAARPDRAALRNLAMTLDVGTAHLAIMHMLGQRLWDSGDQAAAIAFLRRVHNQHPGDFGINLALGDMFFSATSRSLDGALRYYTAASAVRPDSAIAHYRLGRTLFLLRRLDESIAAHRRLVAVDPRYPLAHRKLSYLLAMTGHLDEAIAVCRASPYLQTQDAGHLAGLLNDRARQLCTHVDPKRRDPSRAVDLAREAVARQPTNGAYWETLGVARYRAGRWPEAVAALARWGELQPPGGGAGSFILAMAYWQLGNKAAARKRYDVAAQWMDRNQSQNEDFRRLRTEAEELLGLRMIQ